MTPLQADEIRKMEHVGQLAGELLKYLGTLVRPGITPNELDQIADDWTLSRGAESAPLNYHGYPKSICTSVNEVICHGVPDERPLREGDIVNIDVTCRKEGFHGDTSAIFFVGTVSGEAQRITEAAREAMWVGIDEVKPFVTTGDIGYAIARYCHKKSVFPVKEIGGHGIGRKFHDEPFIPSHGKKGRGPRLKPWIAITVEPMVNLTPAPIKELPIPGSSHKIYVTGDGTLSAQYEHTVLVTDKGHQILTLVD